MAAEELANENADNFLDYYQIFDNSNYYNIILGMYYTYTTLSTVGFGDLAPRSDPERMVCSFILMLGVGIFSIFLGDMTAIIESYKLINKDLDDSDILDDFFGMMEHFNGDKPIKFELKQQMRSHMLYRWNNNRNVLVE